MIIPPDSCNKPLDEREKQAIEIIKEFSIKPKELIEKITVEGLIHEGGVNPYLAKSFGFTSIEEVVEFFLMRRIERSLGTSFGTVLEKFICKIVGGLNCKDLDPLCRKKNYPNKPWYCWWDVLLNKPFTEGEKKWKGIVISIKSGPADMDKDQVEHFKEEATKAEGEGYRPYLSLVYGKQAWGVISGTMKNKGLDPSKYLRIGKEIFKEFLGDETYYNRALELFSQGGLKEDLFEMIEKKKKEMSASLKEKYGNDLEKLLKDTF